MTANPSVRSDRSRSLLICAATAVLAAIVYYSLPPSMNELSRRCAAIFVVAAVFWATEVMPLYATSLCVIGLQVLFLSSDGGIADMLPTQSAWPMKPDGTGPVTIGVTEFFKSFASPIIMLFLGGFLISDALTKHGLDKIICTRLLKPFSKKPSALLWAVLIISAFFSMWMSNTATTAMMLAIIAPIVRDLPTTDKFHRGIILAVPFGANIGGIGTPIGTPPNAVALAALRMAGYQIGFLDWMIMAVPLMVVSLLITGVVLWWFFPADKAMTLNLKVESDRKLDLAGRITLLIMGVSVVLWMTEKWHGVSEAAVALLAAAGLTAMRVLDRRDIDSTDWNVLILMWGGLSLGDAMKSTGLLKWIISLPVIDTINGLPAPWSQYVLATFVVMLTILFASFMSHTAATALIVPMAMAFSPQEAGSLAILVALASSFAMAMPVSTPPNAMAFASGQFPATSMIRSGGVIGICSILILLVGHRAVLPLMLATQQQELAVSRRVAVLAPMTGEFADLGKLQIDGYKMAAHELTGLGIDVRYFDTHVTKDQVPALMTEQVLAWKPDVILGPYNSEMASLVSPMVPVDGPPLLIPTAVVDNLTQRPGTGVFRLAPPIQLMALTVADFIVERREVAEEIWVLAETSDFGKAVAQAITGTCLMRGMKQPRTVLYGEDVSKWADAPTPGEKAILVLVSRSHDDAVALVKRFGGTHRLLGFSGAFSTPAFHQFIDQQATGALREMLVLSPWRNDDASPATQRFLAAYTAEGRTDMPQYHTAQAYSAMLVAGRTIEKAHETHVKPKVAMKGLTLATPIGQVRFMDFGGYYQQNPASAVIQQVGPKLSRTIFPSTD